MSKKQVLLLVILVGLLAYLATGKQKPLPAESPSEISPDLTSTPTRQIALVPTDRKITNHSSRVETQQPELKPEPQNEQEQEAPMKREEFVELTRKALRDLPRKSDLAHLTAEEVHTIPMVLLEKGRILADVVDAVEKNPAYEPEAEIFFKSCASDSSMAVQIRGRCLSHFKRLATKLGDKNTPNAIPDEVQRLANFIP